jgi:tuberous sclerosis protein 2
MVFDNNDVMYFDAYSCVALSCQLERLVMKKSENLRAPCCDCALDLIEALLEVTPTHGDANVQKEIYSHLHSTISRLEALSEDKLYRGSKKKLFDVISLCSKQRPEASVLRLIDYRASGLFPTRPGTFRLLLQLRLLPLLVHNVLVLSPLLYKSHF